MPSQQYNRTEIANLDIAAAIKEKETLRGLAEIAAYLDCSIDTVRRRIKRQGLPAFSIGQGSEYTTTKTIVDAWIREGHYKRCSDRGWAPSKQISQVP